MSGLTIERGQQYIIDLRVAMPFPEAIDWST
jgi:hypothetical protein